MTCDATWLVVGRSHFWGIKIHFPGWSSVADLIQLIVPGWSLVARAPGEGGGITRCKGLTTVNDEGR